MASYGVVSGTLGRQDSYCFISLLCCTIDRRCKLFFPALLSFSFEHLPSMEHPLAADEYYKCGMAFSAAGDFTSALKAFKKGISIYPNHALLKYASRLAEECLPGKIRIGQTEASHKRSRMYIGVDAPINQAAMQSYYSAIRSFCQKDFSTAMKQYGQALKADKDNMHLLSGYRQSVLLWAKDCEKFHSYMRL